MAIDFWPFLGACIGIIGLIVSLLKLFILSPINSRLEKLESKVDQIIEDRAARSEKVSDRLFDLNNKIKDLENTNLKELSKIYQQISSI